jgi:hypothetical protein
MVALGLAGCVGPVDARGLDRICRVSLPDGPACEIAGQGSFGGGVTGDTKGFRLRDGSLVVHLAAAPEINAPGPFDVEVLARSGQLDFSFESALTWGSCAKGCPASPPPSSTMIPREYAWVKVASAVRGTEPGVTLQYDAVMTLSGVATDVADLRITSTP